MLSPRDYVPPRSAPSTTGTRLGITGSPRPDWRPSSTNGFVFEGSEQKPLFDVVTLRNWFIEMDGESSGHVTKDGFMSFLRSRPQLRRLMLQTHDTNKQQKAGGPTLDKGHVASARLKTGASSTRTPSSREAEALEMRRLLKLLKEIDEDKNGTLEWEEFIEFFRRAGYLLEYATKENPREEIASIMGRMHDQKMEGKELDEELADRLSSLGQEHLPSHTRRKSEDFVQKAENTGRRGSVPVPPTAVEETKPVEKPRRRSYASGECWGDF